MDFSLSNSLIGNAVSNPDKLALDLQFSTDKTLTARKGPTPVFTRGSASTYFGPFVEVSAGVLRTTSIFNGRAYWEYSSSGGDQYSFEYTGTNWQLRVQLADAEFPNFYNAAAGIEWRPDQANWSGFGLTITTSSTFGIVRAANNEPRFDHNPVTLACKGLLIEMSRTNLIFPSDLLTTQTRTVTAVAHTLSFYGTGTVVLSGVAVATVIGTGVYPARTTLTFTPTAGSLILTITGTVQYAQLEAGSFATSYIPTTTASAIRSVDICSISPISSFYLGLGTIYCGSQLNGASSLNGICGFATSNSSQIAITRLTNNTRATTSGATPGLLINSGSLASTLFVKSALAFNTNDAAFANNGTLSGTSISLSLPSVSFFHVGSNGAIPGAQFIESGTISEIKYFKKRLSNSKLQAITV